MSHALASRDSAGEEPAPYHRYHIPTQAAPDIEKWPSRFNVHVGKFGLARLLLKEIVHYKGDKEVILSRPCMYGVFSGPVGGFAPRSENCVGCLRCTTEFPEFVRVEPNADRLRLGDSYFTSHYVDVVSYEAATGLVPVKGAGYRGKFGGEGWDGMWTDMSEIVRPTRDGIHGREFISTVVDIGYAPNYLVFDEAGLPTGAQPHSFSLPLPFIFDRPPASAADPKVAAALARAAAGIGGLALLPLDQAARLDAHSAALGVILPPDQIDRLERLPFSPRFIEFESWDSAAFEALGRLFPESVIALRCAFGRDDLVKLAGQGLRVFHFTADYHGRGPGGAFVLDLIRQAHQTFVEAGLRQEVTLLGSGGIVAAEHVPKAIICGLDAVALDTPLLVAMQTKLEGECTDPATARFHMPSNFDPAWGAQRLMNLAASWRDQLLEILGAMGLREVRRLRGEMGRAMLMQALEADAFAGIEGYHG